MNRRKETVAQIIVAQQDIREVDTFDTPAIDQRKSKSLAIIKYL